MTDVIVFHHAQGLTDGVRAFADRLRAAGHQVTVPDLYDGQTFDTLDDGIGYARQIGFDTVMERVAGGRGLAERDRLRRVLPGRAARPAAGPDPPRREGAPALPRLRTAVGVRVRMASGGAGSDPRHGGRSHCSSRRRSRRRPGPRRDRPTTRNCSSTPATSTCSLTPACPRTPTRRRTARTSACCDSSSSSRPDRPRHLHGWPSGPGPAVIVERCRSTDLLVG